MGFKSKRKRSIASQFRVETGGFSTEISRSTESTASIDEDPERFRCAESTASIDEDPERSGCAESTASIIDEDPERSGCAESTASIDEEPERSGCMETTAVRIRIDRHLEACEVLEKVPQIEVEWPPKGTTTEHVVIKGKPVEVDEAISSLNCAGLIIELSDRDDSSSICNYEDSVEPESCLSDLVAPVGLPNAGNICFSNAVCQSLLCVRHRVKECTHLLKGCIEGYCVNCKLDLCSSGPKEPVTFDSSQLKEIFGDYNIGQQQDAHEFFTKLFHDSRFNISHWPFGFNMCTKVTCAAGHVKETLDRYTSHNITLLEGYDLQRSLSTSSSCHDYLCEICNKKCPAMIERTVVDTSDVLVICAERFLPQTKNLTVENNHRIQVQGISYKLCSVVEHIGKTMNEGHYVSYVCYNDVWFLTDDTTIKEVSYEVLRNIKGYLLFYIKDSDRIQPISDQVNDDTATDCGVNSNTSSQSHLESSTPKTKTVNSKDAGRQNISISSDDDFEPGEADGVNFVLNT